MTATPAEPTPATTVTGVTLTAPATTVTPTEPSTAVTTPPGPKPTEPPTPTEPTTNPWEDPVAAKAEIEKLRKENATRRVEAKPIKTAVEEARQELAQTIGKALGLVADEVMDPAKLTESLTTAQADAKKAQVALAVFQNAGTVGDPLALLDSTTFLASVADLDPNDTAAVQAAIAKAVESNPRLGAAPAVAPDPRIPAPLPGQGGSGGGAPDLDAQIRAAQEAGNTSLAIHLQNLKLTPATR